MQLYRHLPLLPQVSSETSGWYHSPGQPYHIYPREAKYFAWLSPGNPLPDRSQRVAQTFQPVPAQAKPLWPFGAAPQKENLLSGRAGGSPLGGTFTVNITMNHRWFTPKGEKSPFGKGGFRGIWVFTVKPAATRNQPPPTPCKTPRPHYNKVCLPGHGF
jgi:hypothetical protein